MKQSIGFQLEQYTLQHPEEVLIVTIEIEAQPEKIIIYKGFSSSLTGQTAFDPDVPLIPETAKIISIDRLASPYQPEAPQYLQTQISWSDMQKILNS